MLAKPGILVCILFVYLAAKLVLLIGLSLHTAFVMDEYWMVVHGLFNVDHLYKEIWPSKTVLYAPVFRILHVLGEEVVEIMFLARAEMAVLAIGSLGLLYLVARQIGRRLDRFGQRNFRRQPTFDQIMQGLPPALRC